jgi:hypothetical protein
MNEKDRILASRLMRNTAAIERILKRDFGCSWFRPKKEDEIRLLRMAQWREKYRVSFAWMLKLLLPIWRKKYARYRGEVAGVGVAISTLVGKKSEEMIKEQIKLEFPNNENLIMWKCNEQQRQWEKVREPRNCREDWMHPGTMIQKYISRMADERGERARWAQQQERRNYRNNPWK